MVFLRGNYIFRYQKMYFLEQIKKQFIAQVVAYNLDGSKWIEDSEKRKPKVEWGEASQAEDLAEKSVKLWKEMKNNEKKFSDTSKALKSEEAREITPVSSKEALSSVKATSPEEKELALEMWKTWENPEDIKEAIFQQRLEKLSSNKITDGEREVIEKEFISEIAAESWVSAELMSDMRALWFADLQSGTPEELADKLRKFSGEMEKVNRFAKNEWFKLPETKEEFITLYNQLKWPDWEVRVPATKKEMEDAGISVDKQWNISFNGPWYAWGERWAWRPYSRWWNVYSWERSSVSPRNYPVDPNLDINNLPPGVEWLMDLIVLKEARGSYDTILDASRVTPPKPISQMTLQEVYRFQKDKMLPEQRARGINPPSSAVWGLQIVSGTLKWLVESNPNINWSDTFGKETQRKMMLALLQEDGLNAYKDGSLSKSQFMENISGTWASFPKNMSWAWVHDGYAWNNAYVDPWKVSEILDQIKQI